MKNILLENMLRFGTKNLSNTNLDDLLRTLNEQTFNSDPNFAIFYSKLGARAKQYWDGKLVGPDKQPLSDTDKEQLYKVFLQKSQKKANIKKTDVTKLIKNELEKVSIGVTPAEVKIDSKPGTKTPADEPLVLTGTWPSVKNPNELSNFYLIDNAIDVSPENINHFNLLIQDLISSVPSSYAITNILVYAGASTSKVPTKYKGGDYGSDIQRGQQNNLFLVQDRCNAITTVLQDLVTKMIPNFTGTVTVDKPQLSPNNGPAYTSKQRSYYFGTGKMDPSKQAEYDKTYGPFKGSYGGVTIMAKLDKTKETEPSETPGGDIVTLKSNWSLSLTWESHFSVHDFLGSIPKLYIGKKGGQPIAKNMRNIRCPQWVNK